MKKHSVSARRICFWAVILFFLAGFLLPAVREGNERLWILSIAVPAVILLCGTLFARLLSMDRLLAVMSVSLCALGILLATGQPDLAVTRALRSAGALLFLFLGITVVHVYRPSVAAAIVPAFIGLVLPVLPLAGADAGFRVELPAWATEDDLIPGLLHGTLIEQCKLLGGHPYPFILHRAHESAVITYTEKEEVKAMLLREMAVNGLTPTEKSNKQIAKDSTKSRN